MVSPRTLLTAGHCLYNHATPARNGNPRRQGDGFAIGAVATPGGHFSLWDPISAVAMDLFPNWVSNNDQNIDFGHDYGVLVLSHAIGNTIGWYGVASAAGNVLHGSEVYVTGFPGASGVPNNRPFGTLWRDNGYLWDIRERQFLHNADTVGGQSGGAITIRQQPRTIVGIHVAGVSAGGVGVHNLGARITNSVVQVILRNR